jgi:hypothetical protein
MTALGLLSGCGSIAHATGDDAGGDDASPDLRDSGGGGDVTEGGVRESSVDESSVGDSSDSSVGESSIPGPDGGDAPTSTCKYTCENPMPVLMGGIDTGYDSCAGGYTRRRAQVMCPSLLPRPGNGACSQVFDASPARCSSDSDCSSDPYGHCELTSPDAGLQAACDCVHGCRVDSDCASGMVCVCANPIGSCAPATCSTGASCGAAGCDCIASSAGSGCGPRFDCQMPEDQCASPGDCTRQDAGVECSESSGIHACGPYNYCGVGRPFLVAGAARLAATTLRADWRAAGITPDLRRLSAPQRRSLGEHWLRVARMEHASIASFARFTMHLLALGAPSELVIASNRAMADETEHARLAFALSSAFLGQEVGPSALSIDGALDGGDLDAFVATLLREGCIGETRAAVEAYEMLDVTRDPAIRDVLQTIVRDETRHAELAWRTLAWLVSSGRARALDVRAELHRAVSEMPAGDGDVASRIVRPCADSLLAVAA